MAYTKRELINALEGVANDTVIDIEIITRVSKDGGVTSGEVHEIDSVSVATDGSEAAIIGGLSA